MRTDRKNKNPLFSFVFAIDHVRPRDPSFKLSDSGQFMPNDIYVLNTGYYLFGTITEGSIKSHLEDEDGSFKEILEIKKPGIQCLSALLFQLVERLNKCNIEPFSIANYISNEKIYTIEGENINRYSIKK